MIAVALLAVAGLAMWRFGRSPAAPAAGAGAGSGAAASHVHIERDGLRYEFDAISNRARLTEIGRPEKDLLLERPADALRLRRAIEADIGRTLESLSDANRETIDALKRMGYL